MNSLFKTVLSLSLSGSLLIVLASIFIRCFHGKLSKRWQYYVWLIIGLHLLVPWGPAFSVIDWSVLDFVPNPADSIAAVENPINQDLLNLDQAGEIALPWLVQSGMRLIENLWFPWLLVAGALLLRKVTIYQSFVKYVRAGQEELAGIGQLNRTGEVCEELGIRQPVDLYSNSLIASPLLLGLWRARIVLPSLAVSEDDLRYILLHELTHLKRKDLLYKWFLQAILCLHWFNPLVHHMVRQVNRLCELACDEAVTRRLTADEKNEYGALLVRSLKTTKTYREPIAALTLSENAVLLQERLTAMKQCKPPAAGKALPAVLCLTLLVSSTLAGAYPASGSYPQVAGRYGYVPPSTPNPLQMKSQAADRAAFVLIDTGGANDGVWYITGYLLPYMTDEGIDEAVRLFNESYSGTPKTSASYYSLPVPAQEETQVRAVEIVQRTSNFLLLEPLLPYMSEDGITEAVLEYNRRTGEQVDPADYY